MHQVFKNKYLWVFIVGVLIGLSSYKGYDVWSSESSSESFSENNNTTTYKTTKTVTEGSKVTVTENVKIIDKDKKKSKATSKKETKTKTIKNKHKIKAGYKLNKKYEIGYARRIDLIIDYIYVDVELTEYGKPSNITIGVELEF